MEAGTLNCPMCGAATSTDAPHCQYCDAQLATVACPSCFAMMFVGSKHCPRCGAAANREADVVDAGRKCPRCKTAMQVATIGSSKVLECAHCLGLWLTTSAFEKICADKGQQSAVLGNASLTEEVVSQRPKQCAHSSTFELPMVATCMAVLQRGHFRPASTSASRLAAAPQRGQCLFPTNIIAKHEGQATVAS